MKLLMSGIFVVLLAARPPDVFADAGNLAVNASFEQAEPEGRPSAWAFFTTKQGSCGLSTNVARSGALSVAISLQQVPDSQMGLLQKIPVDASSAYTFSIFLRSDRDDELKGQVKIVPGIEWLDAAGREVGRAEGQPVRADLSRMRWTKSSVSGRPPRGAVTASFVINIFEPPGKPCAGRLYCDDAEIICR